MEGAPVSRFSSWLPRAAAGGWALLATLWLLEVAGRFEAHGLARVVFLAAAVGSLAWGGWRAVALWRMPRGEERTLRWALAAVLAAAFVVRFAGLDFELVDHPLGDEGVFHEVSQEINGGEPWPETFNYGHFLYYAGAFAIWLLELFPAALPRLLGLVYETVSTYGVERLLLKAVNASLAAITAGAMFGAGRRIAGAMGVARSLPAAVLAGLLIAFSPLYNTIAHQLIADVPAAAFAAIALYYVSRLLDRESTRDYLLAGAAAGLAAASKYPGGLVALAIFALWFYWRIRTRSWSWDLLWAALVSIVALLAVMPAFFVHPERAFSGQGLDLLFGFRQYAYGGWIGVQPESNLAWYGNELLHTFGWPALALGVLGALFLAREQRRRWLLMAVFPLSYLALIVSMSMVVHRNLQVALPGLALLLGVAIAALAARAARWRRGLGPLLLIGALVLPVGRTAAWTASRMRDGTRQQARAWVESHVPEGAAIVRERYSPRLDPERYALVEHRFAAWQDPREMQTEAWDYLILARPSYSRFVEATSFRRPHQEEYKRRYQVMFGFEKVAEFAPGLFRAGPLLSIYTLEPDPVVYRTQRVFLPADAHFLSHEDLRRDGPGGSLRYTRRWQYAVFKEFFAAGEYRVQMGINPPLEEGYLHVVDRRNREVGTFDLGNDVVVVLPRDEKYLLRVFLAPPSRLYGIEVAPTSAGPEPTSADLPAGQAADRQASR